MDRKFCKDCKWGENTGWRDTEVSPFNWQCFHPDALHPVDARPANCDVQRNPKSVIDVYDAESGVYLQQRFCGVTGAWWEPKEGE